MGAFEVLAAGLPESVGAAVAAEVSEADADEWGMVGFAACLPQALIRPSSNTAEIERPLFTAGRMLRQISLPRLGGGGQDRSYLGCAQRRAQGFVTALSSATAPVTGS